MESALTISVIPADVMGGDYAPDAVLKGCIDALPFFTSEDRMVLIGPRELIQDVLNERRIRDARIEIEHAPDQIGMGESPAKAVRSKPDSTIVRMALLGSV